MFRFTRSAFVLFLIGVAACGDGGSLDGPLGQDGLGPAMDISDAAHLPGRDGFYFLPPMVAAPTFSGTFDPGLSPEVKIVCVNATNPTCPTIKTFNGGSGAERVTVDLAGESYNALWNTKRNPNGLELGPDKYRLEVYVGAALLGYADLWFVSNAKGLKAVTDEYVGIVRDGTLTIKFRIETGTVGTVAVTPVSAAILGAGSQLFTATVTDLHGDPLSGLTVDWSSSDTDVATVSPTSGTTNGSGQTTTTASTASESGSTTITASVQGVTGTATLDVTLNQPPVANDDSYTVAEDNQLNVPSPGVLSNDSDPDGDAITASLVAGPTNGTLTFNDDGSFVYTPTVDIFGPDAFTYVANDGTVDSNVATVNITVTPVNDAPVAVDDSYTIAEDVTLVVPAATGVLANDTDIDNLSFAAILVSGPTNGVLALNADGSFTYTPDVDFNGADSFTYKANDGITDSNVATVTITVTGVDDAPVAVDDSHTVPEDAAATAIDVLANDTDADGGAAASIVSVTQPANGTVVITGGGSGLTYQPDANYCNEPPGTTPDAFTYTLSPGGSTATVTVTVTCVNDVPVAVADAYSTDEDVPLVVSAPGVLFNDTDIDGGTLTAVKVTDPANGTLALAADGSFTYTPNANFNGADSFTYEANDGTGNSNTVTVSLTIKAVPDAPTAVADAYDALGNVQASIPTTGVLTNDTDVDGDALAVVPATPTSANGGSVNIAADGSFTYVSAAGFNGPDSFDYTVTDGVLTAVGTVSMTVTGRYWFVDAAAAPGGDGRQTSKFQSLTPLDGAGGAADPDQVNDIILVNSGTYSSAIQLENGQQLIGQGIPADLTATVNGQTVTLLAAGAAPTINADAGNTITLGSGNTLRGFVAGTSTDASISGSAVGTLTVANVNISNGSGRALDLTTSGTLAAAFGSISATGGTGNGINLVSQTGALTSGTTSITNPSGTGIHVQGSAGFNFGTTTVNKAASSGTGVHLQTNSGTTTFGSLAVTTNSGTGLFTSSAGTVNVGSGTIAATGGPAVDATSTTFSGTGFSSTSSTGSPVSGVSLTTVAGTVNLGGGSISKTSGGGTAFAVASSSATVNYAGSLNVTSGGGVSLTGNSGTTTFSGGMTLATGANPGFTATGGGTVAVCDENPCNAAATGALMNTITTTTGTALNVNGTNISSNNLEFRSISANGAANGIVLNNTGASGALKLKGTGSASSGGTIQNVTDHAVVLTNTSNPAFNNINIQNAGRSGIDGQQVTNFTLTNSTINNVGTAAAGQYDESNISFNDNGAFTSTAVSGTVTITNNVLTNARRHGVQIENGTGTISNLTITGNTLTSSAVATASLGTAIVVLQQGSAGTTSHLTTGTIANNTITHFPSAEGILIAGGTGNATNNTSSTLGANGTPIAITGNVISGGTGLERMGSNAIRASFNGQVGVSNFNISGNGTAGTPITNIQGQGISVFMGGTVTGTTTINNNFIVPNQTLGAGTQGLAVQVDDGPAGLGTSAADYNVVITNNAISNYEGFGIRAIARASLGKMDVTIQNNTVGTPLLLNRNGIRVDAGSAAGDVTLCLLMTGNTSSGSGVNQGMGIRKQGVVATVNDFGIVGLAPSPTTGANAAAKVTADNPAGNGTDAISGDNYVSCTITP